MSKRRTISIRHVLKDRGIEKRQFGVCTWCGKPAARGRRYWCGDACLHEYQIRSNPGYARRCVEKRDKGVCCRCGLDTVKLRADLLAELAGAFILKRSLEDRAQLLVTLACGLPKRTIIDQVKLIRQHRWKRAKGTHIPYGLDWVGKSYSAERLRDVVAKCAELHLKTALYDGMLKGRTSACECVAHSKLRSLGLRWRGHWWEMDHVLPVIEGGGECGMDGLRTCCLPCHKLETAALARRRAAKKRNQK
jgi:hypothetical protein